MKIGRARPILVALLLASIAASFMPFSVPPVHAAITLTVTPSSARPGDTVFWNAVGITSTSCTLTGSVTNLVTAVTMTLITSTGKAFGTFRLGTGTWSPGSNPFPPGGGPYTVTLSCTNPTDSDDFSTFTVLPIVFLGATTGTANQTVGFSGAGFDAAATLCALSSPVATMTTCSFIDTGVISGNFKVFSGAADGSYNMTISANVGASAIVQFTKVSGPTISVSPNSVPPGYGTSGGAAVVVSGGGFSTAFGSRSCQLSSSGGAAFFASTSCTINTDGTVTGNFGVSQLAAPGTYRINVTDNNGNGARASFSGFIVTLKPVITLTPNSGPAGTFVNITVTAGAFANPFDVGPCTLASTPGGLIASGVCFINNTGYLSVANFQVASSAGGGGYTVVIVGLHGDVAQASFTVTAISVNINPTFGSPPVGVTPGTSVTITGSGYSSLDTSCIVRNANTTLPNIVAGLSCGVSSGSLTATWTVAAGSFFGKYVLNVTGTPGFDTRTINFTVRPRLQLVPNSGTNATQVSLLGTGYNFTAIPVPCGHLLPTPDQGVKSSPSTLLDSGAATTLCTLYPNGTVSGSFRISPGAAIGAYGVTVTGLGAGSGSFNDTAVATFVLTTRLLTLNPTSGFPGAPPVFSGTFVQVTGSGFNPTDTLCSLTSSPSNLFKTGTVTCGVTSGNIQASFQVNDNIAAGIYTVFVSATPAGDAGVGAFIVGVVTATTTTSTSFSSSTTSTTTSTTSTSIGTSISQSTTTFQTTGVSTQTFTSFTRTTTSQARTSVVTQTIFVPTTIYVASSTVISTTSTTVTKTFGQAISGSFAPDSFGMLALALFALLFLLRRLKR